MLLELPLLLMMVSVPVFLMPPLAPAAAR